MTTQLNHMLQDANDEVDLDAAKERLQKMGITAPTLEQVKQEKLKEIIGVVPGATLHAEPSQAPAPNRKPRSDKGVPKKPPADPDEIAIKMTSAQAHNVALWATEQEQFGLAAQIQNQIIAHLRKQVDLLTKQK